MNKHEMDKVQSCFEAALAVSGQQRLDYLAELMRDDPFLGREVEALLQADADSKAWEAPVRARSEADTRSLYHGYGEGDAIGPYRIVEHIGTGGMGVIYKAHDSRLDRHVALKFLPAGMHDDSQIRQRFLAEARAASRLDHASICTVFDVGETPEGEMYITMPCYQGETLANRTGRGPIAQPEAVDIAVCIAEGLKCAHQHQIVHRDIKPSNIMLTENGGVKILDFGIAKVADVHLTSTGMSIGTLAYMSPEQLRGETVDARTDIWALGVVLFECLSGKSAFPGKALPDILHAVLQDTTSPLDRLDSPLPPLLTQLLQQALARDLDRRYADMDSMLSDLYQVQSALQATDATTTGTRLQPRASAYAWDDQVLDRITALLMPVLGPIAPVMVKRQARKAADLGELRERLGEALPDPASRDRFNRQLENQIAALTSPPAPMALTTGGSLAGVDLSPAQRAEIEACLIPALGPIAPTMLKRHASRAASSMDLCDTLARHVTDARQKQAFIDTMHKLFGTG